MTAKFCFHKLEELTRLVRIHGNFMLTLCVLHLIHSLVATLGNLFAICALWKASSIPDNLKKLFLSLACSDLAVGLFGQLMLGVIIAVMLKMAANGSYDYDFLCPTLLTVCYFSMSLLACASFLNVTTTAVDRLLAVFLHLRYQELVTSKRVSLALVALWFISGVAAFMFVSLPSRNSMVIAIIELVGLLLATVAYFRIYKAVRYHRNQIQSQIEQPHQETNLLREKKSAFNALVVYVVFVACYLPNLCTEMLINDSLQIPFLLAIQVSLFLVLLNSSLNPVVYCWRYREIREVANKTAKKIFCVGGT